MPLLVGKSKLLLFLKVSTFQIIISITLCIYHNICDGHAQIVHSCTYVNYVMQLLFKTLPSISYPRDNASYWKQMNL